MKSILSILALVLCLGVATSGFAADKAIIETWECVKPPYRTDILVIAKVFEGRKIGRIDVAGVTYKTIFKVQGFTRRWNFGDGFIYSLLIEPGGEGAYYDFSSAKEGESVQPSYLLRCKMK
jgi:hypothetical protein